MVAMDNRRLSGVGIYRMDLPHARKQDRGSRRERSVLFRAVLSRPADALSAEELILATIPDPAGKLAGFLCLQRLTRRLQHAHGQ